MWNILITYLTNPNYFNSSNQKVISIQAIQLKQVHIIFHGARNRGTISILTKITCNFFTGQITIPLAVLIPKPLKNWVEAFSSHKLPFSTLIVSKVEVPNLCLSKVVLFSAQYLSGSIIRVASPASIQILHTVVERAEM